VPEEVIAIEKLVKKIEKKNETKSEHLKNGTKISLELPNGESNISENESSDLLLKTNENTVPAKKMARNSKSLIDVDQEHRNGLLAAKSESKILSGGRKFVNIDANFSPFKKLEPPNGSDPVDLPKMKIFLPKNSDSSDDDGSSSEEETDPLSAEAAIV
jgi:hypothetical protein